MRELMTPEQVAEYLQMTTDTVYRLIRQHKLAATRIGRSYRIPKEDLKAFLVGNSSHAQVRAAQFRRVLAIGERHPTLNSDQLLDELEREDQGVKTSEPSRR